ncbi:MAG: glycosyltransferase family 1 protein [Legionellaceae bacterium]|nr:glycosyltransferase family 1 protein [Legionellaceae bacterium]
MSFKQSGNPMHIGFDVSQTGSNKAGCGFYAHALIQAMLDISPETHYSLYPSFGDFYFDVFMPVKNPYKKGNYGPRHVTRDTAGTFWKKNNVEAQLNKPDIIHANNFWCPTQLKTSRLIYTLYDMGFLVDPNWTTETNRIGCYNGVFRASLAADWIVAISEASRNHYLEVFPHFPEERIRVIYPCSRFADTNRLGVRPKALNDIPEGGFWLSVGTIEPRKNQRRLAEAYARYLALNGKPMPLVFAGGHGWLMDDFQKRLQALGIEDQVIMTGYVSDDELIWLYRSCYASLYPTLFEGFGLPVLEGMQYGAPTITTRTSSIPEVAGDAAMLLSPEDTSGWAEAMLALSLNPTERLRMSSASKQRAREFDWKQSAAALLDLYREALSEPKRGG